MVESGKTTLSSQFVQVPDTFTNFHRPRTSRSGSVPIMSITYLKLVFILPIKFHPGLSTLSVFQDIRFPRFRFPPSGLLCPRIRFKLKRSIWDVSFFYISSFNKIRSPIRKIKIPQFSRFPRFPPSTPPNVTGSGWDSK